MNETVIDDLVRKALAAAYEQGRKDEREGVRTERASWRPSPSIVLAAIRRASGIADFSQPGGLVGRSRKHAWIRMGAAVLLREDCDLSYPAVAKLLSYSDHTTVMYAMKHWTEKPDVVALVRRCREAFTALAARQTEAA